MNGPFGLKILKENFFVELSTALTTEFRYYATQPLGVTNNKHSSTAIKMGLLKVITQFHNLSLPIKNLSSIIISSGIKGSKLWQTINYFCNQNFA